MVVAQAQLPGGADHAVGDVAVGLAGGDREAAGQHRAGQDDHDQVAGGEVAGAADDPRGSAVAALCGPTSTWHQRIGLPFICGSLLELEHPADHERAR